MVCNVVGEIVGLVRISQPSGGVLVPNTNAQRLS